MRMDFTPEDSETWIKRAYQFLASAKNNLDHDRPEIAAFESEQAAQLALKARIFQLEEIIPRTRSLRELLRRLALLTGNHDINQFIAKNLSTIRLLEESHDRSRYSTHPISKQDARKCFLIASLILQLITDSTKNA